MSVAYACSNQLRERVDEHRIVVQRLDPVELDAELVSLLPRHHVEIPQDLEVIRDEADRREEHLPNAARVELLEVQADIRAEPGLTGRALALECERPAAQPGAGGDEACSREQLVAVGVAGRENALREAVSSEDDVRGGPAHALGDHIDVGAQVVPALDEIERRSAVERRLHAVAVAAHRSCE